MMISCVCIRQTVTSNSLRRVASSGMSVDVLVMCVVSFVFFFSSRRRHTRCLSDWSSDVCSSDLPGPLKNRTTVERKSDREVVVTRTINGPARIVFEAFTKAELLKRWWVPKSMGMTLLFCEVDARVGGKYQIGRSSCREGGQGERD